MILQLCIIYITILPSQISGLYSADTYILLFSNILENRISLRNQITRYNACEKIVHLTTCIPHRLFWLLFTWIQKKQVVHSSNNIIAFFNFEILDLQIVIQKTTYLSTYKSEIDNLW